MPGFAKGRKLDKIGLKVQDTAELSFSDVRVPAANRLGEEGKAFGYLGHNLPQERLTIAVGSVAQSRAAVTAAAEYAKTRLVFGQELSVFQNTKFELAACYTEVEAAQALLDKALGELVDGELSPADAAMVKLFTSEMQARVVDRCLQIFGGYGSITEYPIARLYADARVTRCHTFRLPGMKPTFPSAAMPSSTCNVLVRLAASSVALEMDSSSSPGSIPPGSKSETMTPTGSPVG
jgi:acyl-CoA dehydrogenase